MCRTSEVPSEGEAKRVNEIMKSHPVTDFVLEVASEELLKLFRPGGISKPSRHPDQSKVWGWGAEKRKQMKPKPQKMRVENNLLFWQEMIQVIEPEIRGTNAY